MRLTWIVLIALLGGCAVVPRDNQALHEELVAAAALIPDRPPQVIHEFVVVPNR